MRMLRLTYFNGYPPVWMPPSDGWYLPMHSDVSCPSPRNDQIGMLRQWGVMLQISLLMTKIRTRTFIEEAGVFKQAEVV